MKEEKSDGTAQPEQEGKIKKYLRLGFAYLLGAFFVLLIIMLVLRKCGT
jgi:hypothetical protein